MPVRIIDNVKRKLDEHVSNAAGMMYLSIDEVRWLLSEIERLEKRGDDALVESGKRWAKLNNIKTILNEQ